MTSRLFTLLFPTTPRRVPCERAISITLRTGHLMTSGLLLGGHAFDVAPHRLILLLYLTIASGVGLAFLELYSSCRWIYLGKGILVILKVALLLAAGVWWEQRVVFLLLVVLVGSVGSHMPARYRYYSLIHRRVISDPVKVPMEAPVSVWRQ